jgi:hypothetical protein
MRLQIFAKHELPTSDLMTCLGFCSTGLFFLPPPRPGHLLMRFPEPSASASTSSVKVTPVTSSERNFWWIPVEIFNG